MSKVINKDKELVEENQENPVKKSWVLDKIESLGEEKKYKGTDFNKINKENWHVSTGSIILDEVLSSDKKRGITSQIVKIYGEFGAGKSSFLLNIAKNFQKLGKNFFVFYVDAEGRLDDKLIEQSGISTDPLQWHVEKCNQAETVFGKMRDIILENNTKSEKDYTYFCFVIDSSDALVRHDDLTALESEGFVKSFKVAGVSQLSKTFMRTTTLPITSGKHLLLMTGQVISNINLANPNAKKTAPSGGVGVKYFSSTMLEVIKPWTKTKIWEGEKEIGHYFELHVEKTKNNTRAGEKVMIPIKKNFEPGEAIWREVECKDLMISFQLLVKGTTGRFEISPAFSEELTANGIEHETKFHGETKMIDYLTSNPKLVDYTMNKLESIIFL